MYESPILYILYSIIFLMVIFQIHVSLPQGNPWIMEKWRHTATCLWGPGYYYGNLMGHSQESNIWLSLNMVHVYTFFVKLQPLDVRGLEFRTNPVSPSPSEGVINPVMTYIHIWRPADWLIGGSHLDWSTMPRITMDNPSPHQQPSRIWGIAPNARGLNPALLLVVRTVPSGND